MNNSTTQTTLGKLTIEERIQRLLDGNTISANARKFLESQDASLTMCVVATDDGNRRVVYGDLCDGAGSFDGLNVPIEWILESAESNDNIPLEWEDDWDYVEVPDNNAVGFTYETRSDMPRSSRK